MTGWTDRQKSHLHEALAQIVWIREYDNTIDNWEKIAKLVAGGASHDGDCTGVSHTCLVCQVSQVYQAADEYAAAVLSALPSPSAARDKALEEQERLLEDFAAAIVEGEGAFDDEVWQHVMDMAEKIHTEVPWKSSPPAPDGALIEITGLSILDDGRAEARFGWPAGWPMKIGSYRLSRGASDLGRSQLSDDGRRQGHSKLVYDKATRSIVTVSTSPASAELAAMRRVVEAAEEGANALERIASCYKPGDTIGDEAKKEAKALRAALAARQEKPDADR